MTPKTVNPLGQVVSVVDAAGHTSAYAYGPFGKLEQVTSPDGVASTVSYNEAGHRMSLAAPDLGGTLAFQTNSLEKIKGTQPLEKIKGTQPFMLIRCAHAAPYPLRLLNTFKWRAR